MLVGSALAYRGIPLQSAYCGAKHAIQGFHDSLRSELLHAKSNVRTTMVQLPGVNTPQFDWIRTTMPDKPRPASPPYQPEVAADAIHFAAHSNRKSVKLGWPTLKAVWGDRLASPLVDRYLARTGFSGQQSGTPVSPDRRDNLYEPVPGDHGAHGRFDDEARTSSSQLWVTKHGAALGVAADGDRCDRSAGYADRSQEMVNASAKRISDYAIIGDGETAALVSKSGPSNGCASRASIPRPAWRRSWATRTMAAGISCSRRKSSRPAEDTAATALS